VGRLARRLIAHQQGVAGPEQGGRHRQQGGPAEIVGPGARISMAPTKPARVARMRARLTCSLRRGLTPGWQTAARSSAARCPCQMGTGTASAHSQNWMPTTARATRSRCSRSWLVISDWRRPWRTSQGSRQTRAIRY
jgi:hypothetical protein